MKQTHDLRRHNAKYKLALELDNGKTSKEAKKVVQKELGHENVAATNIYLGGEDK